MVSIVGHTYSNDGDVPGIHSGDDAWVVKLNYPEYSKSKAIAIKASPTKLTYQYDEPLDVSGGIIKVTKFSGVTEATTVTYTANSAVLTAVLSVTEAANLVGLSDFNGLNAVKTKVLKILFILFPTNN